MKERLLFAEDLSPKDSADSYLCFRLALLLSVSYFFFLYQSPSLPWCTVSYSVSSNIDQVLSINPSVNVFVFRDFNVLCKDWLTYSGGTGRPGELCYNFSFSNDLTQMLNFYLLFYFYSFSCFTWIPDCDSHSPAFWTYFLLLLLVFVLQWLSLHREILIMLLAQFPFHEIHNRVPHLIAWLMTFLELTGTVFVII